MKYVSTKPCCIRRWGVCNITGRMLFVGARVEGFCAIPKGGTEGAYRHVGTNGGPGSRHGSTKSLFRKTELIDGAARGAYDLIGNL